MLVEPLKETPPISRAVVRVAALAAEPVVSWLPTTFTPGRSMSAKPLKETPPIARAIVNVAADPDHAPPESVPVPSVILVPETAPVNVPPTAEISPDTITVPSRVETTEGAKLPIVVG